MPTRTLHGWTPGSPIDGHRLRLYKTGLGGGLAGTYESNYDDNSIQVSVLANTGYLYDLRSFREADESTTGLTGSFYVPATLMEVPKAEKHPTKKSQRWSLWDWLFSWIMPTLYSEYIPPPTGTVTVSNP